MSWLSPGASLGVADLSVPSDVTFAVGAESLTGSFDVPWDVARGDLF